MGFKVGDEYRTNPLSFKPGGYTICVQKVCGEVLEYNKVKKPMAYMRSLENRDDIVNVWVKDLKEEEIDKILDN